MSQNCTLKMVKTVIFMLCTFHPNKKAYQGNCLHSETIHFSLLSKVLFLINWLRVFQSNKFQTSLDDGIKIYIKS